MARVKTKGNRQFETIQLYTRTISIVWRTPVV